jgi:hypothetical protein
MVSSVAEAAAVAVDVGLSVERGVRVGAIAVAWAPHAITTADPPANMAKRARNARLDRLSVRLSVTGPGAIPGGRIDSFSITIFSYGVFRRRGPYHSLGLRMPLYSQIVIE